MGDPTLAEQLVQVLRQAGVERAYGVVGDSLNPVVDAIRRTDGIEWVHVQGLETHSPIRARHWSAWSPIRTLGSHRGPEHLVVVEYLTGRPVSAGRQKPPQLSLGPT
jgi:pyruvate dehydrogenase (quinone)